MNLMKAKKLRKLKNKAKLKKNLAAYQKIKFDLYQKIKKKIRLPLSPITISLTYKMTALGF